MIISFILGVHYQNSGHLQQMAECLTCYRDEVSPVVMGESMICYYSTTTGVHSTGGQQPFFIDNNDAGLLVGEVVNMQAIRAWMMSLDIASIDQSDVQLIFSLYKYMGLRAFTLLQGRFIYLMVRDGRLFCISDPMGQLSLYYQQTGKAILLSTEIKTFTATEGVMGIALREESILSSGSMSISSLFHGINKLEAGVMMTVDPGESNAVPESRTFQHLDCAWQSSLPSKTLGKLWLDTLAASVDRHVPDNQPVCATVSGGVDSGAIAALATQKAGKLHTFSIGTERSNEFAEAAELAVHIGSHHHEIMLTMQDILTGIVQNLYYNEVIDPLSLEILSPFPTLCRHAAFFGGTLLTGYGADLLLAGTLQYEDPKKINQQSYTLINRAIHSGEFNPFVGFLNGISLQHPFWSRPLAQLGLSIPGAYKNNGSTVKYLFREAVAESGILPDKIAWRRKLGIHEGSSISSMVDDYIGKKAGKVDIGAIKRKLYFYMIHHLWSSKMTGSQLISSDFFDDSLDRVVNRTVITTVTGG